MINRAELKNFGPIEQLDWQNLGKINLIIGNNGCGKSFLLKALYSAVRTLEDYKRGDNPSNAAEILANKLYWTFQAEKIGDLVNKKAESPLSFKLIFDKKLFDYSFGKDTTKAINLENQVTPRTDNSVYLPAKEVLSLFHIILDSREHNKLFGFDDTYLDLARALLRQHSGRILFQKQMKENINKADILGRQFSSLKEDLNRLESKRNKEHLKLLEDLNRRIKELEELGKDLKFNPDKYLLVPQLPIPSQPLSVFHKCQKQLDNMLGGKIEYDYDANRWQFKQGNQKFSVGVMAEGIKKIAILDTLLGNGYLNENSIIFIDEPESALHPQAISQLLDIIAALANHGIQFFLASHSYFVIKKLFLIAQEQQMPIPVLSYQNDKWIPSDLKNDLPDNPIIDESIRLYEQQLDMD